MINGAMFTRQNPSPRYLQLSSLYAEAHESGLASVTPDRLFDGASFAPHVERIKVIISATGARTMLDYGSGKATAVRDRTRLLGLDSITCFDPGVPEFSTFPAGQKFDLVISTDVMEHIPEQDLPWVIHEMFSAARLALFANIANFPAHKILPNGENAHVTLRPLAWWRALFADIAKGYPSIRYECLVTEQREQSFGSALVRRLRGKAPKTKFVYAEFSSAI